MTTWIFIGGVFLVGLITGAGVTLIYAAALHRGDGNGQLGSD